MLYLFQLLIQKMVPLCFAKRRVMMSYDFVMTLWLPSLISKFAPNFKKRIAKVDQKNNARRLKRV